MRDETDNNTIDLFGDAEPQSATQQVNSLLPIDIEQPAQPDEQKARARVNSVSFDALQDQAKIHALKFASKAIRLGYEHKHLFCYTDAHGQPIYFKTRHEHPTFYNLPPEEQERIADLAAAKKHKWIRVLSLNHESGQWQLKAPDFKTVYPAGNGKKPLYRLLDIVQAEPDQVVYLFEGEQKADYAASLGLLATTCGGSNDIAATDLEPLTGRFIVIWADHDEPGIKARDKLKAALQAIGCTVSIVDVAALGLPEKGDIIDWAELRGQDGLDTTKADIEALPIVHCEPPQSQVLSGSSDGAGSAQQVEHSSDRLMLDDGTWIENSSNGLYHISVDAEGEVRPFYISQPLNVLGEARDATSTNWKKVLRFKDRDGKEHTVVLPYESFIGEATEALKLVANHGLTPPSGSKRKNLLINYINGYSGDKRFTCVDRAGWYDDIFVLPHKVFGSEDILYSGEAKNPYGTSGTIENWQELSQLIEPHSLAVFCFASSFAGQLVGKLGFESGGFHIHGSSTDGKSTIAVAACSVWGNPNKHRLTWRTTDNAAENNAEIRNDSFAVFDELKQATAKAVDAMMYMLSAGDGKDRASRSAKNRNTKHWNLVYISTGEISLDVHLSRGGIEADAGQLLRFAHIPSDAGHNIGVFETLNYGNSAKDLAERIAEISRNNYGLAGEAWLTYLQANLEQATAQAKLFVDEFMQRFASNCNSQAQRVGRRFALVAAAGELATQVGITKWQKGRSIEAAGQCFNKWLSNFGDGVNLEQIKILSQVRAFFQANGSSRFESLNPPIMASGDDMPQRINNRVGYFRQDGEGKTYLVYPEQFKTEVCQGHDYKQVVKVLKSVNWLSCNANENMKSERIPESDQPKRMYVFNSNMWKSDHIPDDVNSTRNTTIIRNNLEPQGLELFRVKDMQHVTDEKHVTEKPLVTSVADSLNSTRNTVISSSSRVVTCNPCVTDTKQQVQKPASTKEIL